MKKDQTVFHYERSAIRVDAETISDSFTGTLPAFWTTDADSTALNI